MFRGGHGGHKTIQWRKLRKALTGGPWTNYIKTHAPFWIYGKISVQSTN